MHKQIQNTNAGCRVWRDAWSFSGSIFYRILGPDTRNAEITEITMLPIKIQDVILSKTCQIVFLNLRYLYVKLVHQLISHYALRSAFSIDIMFLDGLTFENSCLS